jgi:hypothetical protein
MYCAPGTVTVTKLSQKSVACSTYGDIGNVRIVWAGKLEVNDQLGRYKRIWDDIIKSYINTYDTIVWNLFIWSTRRDTAGYCERRNEFLVSMQCRKFLG